MKLRKQQDIKMIWKTIQVALKLTASGLAVGAVRWVWGTWFLLSAAWIVLMMMTGAASFQYERHVWITYLVTYGPPAVVLYVVLVLHRIISGVRELAYDVTNSLSSAAPSSRPEGNKQFCLFDDLALKQWA